MINLSITINRIIRLSAMTGIHRPLATGLILTLGIYLGGGALAASRLLSDGGPAAMEVDLLPGNQQNTVNLGRQRLIPVAIFGSAELTSTTSIHAP